MFDLGSVDVDQYILTPFPEYVLQSCHRHEVLTGAWGWSHPCTLNDEYKNNNQHLLQADKELDFIVTPDGRKMMEMLFDAYRQGAPVSMPGANRAVIDSIELIQKIMSEPMLTTTEKQLLQDLLEWAEAILENGSLHDMTEQLSTCVSLVYRWWEQFYSHGCHHIASRDVSTPGEVLSKILKLPWALFQRDNHFFINKLNGLRRSNTHRKCVLTEIINDNLWFPIHLRIPRISTYEEVSAAQLLLIMGSPTIFIGYLKRTSEFTDGRKMSCIDMPWHDRGHARFMVAALLSEIAESVPVSADAKTLFNGNELLSEARLRMSYEQQRSIFSDAMTPDYIAQFHYCYRHLSQALDSMNQYLESYDNDIRILFLWFLFFELHEFYSFWGKEGADPYMARHRMDMFIKRVNDRRYGDDNQPGILELKQSFNSKDQVVRLYTDFQRAFFLSLDEKRPFNWL